MLAKIGPRHFRFMALVSVIVLGGQGSAFAQQCLHGPQQSLEQGQRRRLAIGFLLDFNAAQSRQHRETGRYASMADVPPTTDVPYGFVPRVFADAFGYLVKLTDALDPCEFSLFSDERGVVFEAQPVHAERLHIDPGTPQPPVTDTASQ